MDRARIEKLRGMMLSLAAELRAVDAGSSADRGPRELDQQAVGRLSRIDSLQVQAMALETSRRRAAQLGRIEAALERMESGEYGFCVECGEEIAARRLDLDPAAPLCISCASGG